MDLNVRELSTVLAALRTWQIVRNMDVTDSIMEPVLNIATNCGTCTPLTDGEIDDLCEWINVGGTT